MDYTKEINIAKEKFGKLLEEQLKRADEIKNQKNFVDYSSLDKIIIGVVGGDGIGPAITNQSKKILEYLLEDKIKTNKVEFRNIEDLTIEKRAELNQAIPDYVLDELKKCDVILKGPTTTPREGDQWPNIESANVAMRKELDLFANVRPVVVSEENIDWTFFRENTEGAYALGSNGFDVSEDLAIDFTITTKEGTERIIKSAFEYAVKNNKTKITAVTKANIIKTTDGNFLKAFYEIGKEYPNISCDDWYIDIMTAKLLDKDRRSDFEVFVLPNLYGDILTDEAAEFQGGVGTAGSANFGKKYSMFEAIHGSAPRMVEEGRDIYADPSSVIRAGEMLLAHIGFNKEADLLKKALYICTVEEKKLKITGRDTGATNEEFSNYIISTIENLKRK